MTDCIGTRWYTNYWANDPSPTMDSFTKEPMRIDGVVNMSYIIIREDYLNQFINDLFQDTTSIFDNEDQMIHVREWLREGLIPPKESEAGE